MLLWALVWPSVQVLAVGSGVSVISCSPAVPGLILSGSNRWNICLFRTLKLLFHNLHLRGINRFRSFFGRVDDTVLVSSRSCPCSRNNPERNALPRFQRFCDILYREMFRTDSVEIKSFLFLYWSQSHIRLPYSLLLRRPRCRNQRYPVPSSVSASAW